MQKSAFMSRLSFTRAHFMALLAVDTVLMLDQVSKYLIRTQVLEPAGGQITLTSFFNLTTVWNYGVSFGLFQAGSPMARYTLIGLTGLITLALVWWFFTQRRPLMLGGLAMIIAGALGNLIDRVIFGAVFDFLDFHIATYAWPAFNVADISITLGLGLVLLASWQEPPKDPQPEEDHVKPV